MRFSDSAGIKEQATDFVTRDYHYELRKLVIVFGAAIGVIILLSLVLVASGNVLFGIICIIAVMLGLSAYTIYLKQANIDLLQSTEFQNAIFSSAADLGYDFTMIMRQDGTIVHTSAGVSRMFPELEMQQELLLDGIFDASHVSNEDRNRIRQKLTTGETGSVIFSINNTDKTQESAQKIILSLVPLPRPRGFCVVRGRMYVETREHAISNAQPNINADTHENNGIGGKPSDPSVVQVTESHGIHASTILSLVDQPLYASDAQGTITYINEAFEELIGYSYEDILTQAISLNDIIHRTDNHATGEFTLGSFAGTALFECKNNTLVRVYLKHQAIESEETPGKLAATTGSMRVIEE